MRAAAKSNTLLANKTEDIQQKGITVGYLGANSASGTVRDEDALVLSYGYGNTALGEKQIAICVALEHGADPSLATPTVAAVLNQYFAQ